MRADGAALMAEMVGDFFDVPTTSFDDVLKRFGITRGELDRAEEEDAD